MARLQTSLAAHCFVCEDPWDEGDRPQRNVTANCEHEIETCRDCLSEYMGNKLAESSLDQIKCPSGDCKERLSYKNIQEAVGHETLEMCANPFLDMPC